MQNPELLAAVAQVPLPLPLQVAQAERSLGARAEMHSLSSASREIAPGQ